MITDSNSEEWLVQQTPAEHLALLLGQESTYKTSGDFRAARHTPVHAHPPASCCCRA